MSIVLRAGNHIARAVIGSSLAFRLVPLRRYTTAIYCCGKPEHGCTVTRRITCTCVMLLEMVRSYKAYIVYQVFDCTQ